MSRHDQDFDEFLRRVLREEADAVEPADDGLERIRARLTRPRPAPVAWVMAVFSGTGRRVQGAARSVWVWLQTLPGAAQARLRSPQGGRSQRWRSPAVLAACAAIAVAAGVLALTPLPGQAVSSTAALFRSFGGGHGGGTAGQGGQAADGSGPQPAPGPASSSPPGKRAHRSTASPSPSVTPSPAPDSASASSSAAASPSPSPTPTPTPSCPSTSGTPGASPSPTPSSGACPTPTPTPTAGPTTGSTATPAPTPDPAAG